jgi:RNA polymerase sigma factor (sigma-70 family)
MPDAMSSASRPRTDFAETQWSVVAAAGDKASPRAAAALDALCETYWFPVYAYVRRRGHSAHDAQDLTQDFFGRIIEDNSLARVDRNKGKFRSYLLGALNHFLADEWDKSQTQKRGGGRIIRSLEEAEEKYLQVAGSDTTPERAFDRRWGAILIDKALKRLEEESRRSVRNRKQFNMLKRFLINEPGTGEYKALALELDSTAGGVAVLVSRLRKRFRNVVRAELAQTVSSQADLEEELRYLFFE